MSILHILSWITLRYSNHRYIILLISILIGHRHVCAPNCQLYNIKHFKTSLSLTFDDTIITIKIYTRLYISS